MARERETEEPKRKDRILDRVVDDEEEEIPIGEEQTPDDDGAEPVEANAPEEANRDQKKRDRFRENKRAATEAAQRAKDMEDRAVRAEARAAAIETTYRIESDRQRQAATPKEDPLDKEDERLAGEQQGVLDQFEALQGANKLTPEMAKTLRERAMSLQKQRVRIAAKQELAASGTPQNVVTVDNIGQHSTANYIRANYGDIVNDPVALAEANARHLRAVRKEGKPDTQATLDEIMLAVRAEFSGAPPPRQVSAAARRGATSISTGGGGGLGAGTGRKAYTPTKDERRIARAMYPSLDEKAAVHKWVNTVKPYED